MFYRDCDLEEPKDLDRMSMADTASSPLLRDSDLTRMRVRRMKR